MSFFRRVWPGNYTVQCRHGLNDIILHVALFQFCRLWIYWYSKGPCTRSTLIPRMRVCICAPNSHIRAISGAYAHLTFWTMAVPEGSERWYLACSESNSFDALGSFICIWFTSKIFFFPHLSNRLLIQQTEQLLCGWLQTTRWLCGGESNSLVRLLDSLLTS